MENDLIEIVSTGGSKELQLVINTKPTEQMNQQEAKEQAKEFVAKFKFTQRGFIMPDVIAKQCAIIAVEEILNSNHAWNKETSQFVKDWNSVKESINKL